MKARKFATHLKDAGLTMWAVNSPEPDVVVRFGRDGTEQPVQAVKVRHEFQRDKAFIILEIANQYPTEDAYLSACRANHWRTAQLRAHGIEPIRMPADASHYPPDDFDWEKAEKNG